MTIVLNNHVRVIHHPNTLALAQQGQKTCCCAHFMGIIFQVVSSTNTVRKVKDIVSGQQYYDGCIFIYFIWGIYAVAYHYWDVTRKLNQ